MPAEPAWLRTARAKGLAVTVGPAVSLPLAADAAEAEFQARVEAHAAARGWLWYHTRDSRGSAEGFPDLVLVRGRRVVWAELKAAAGEPSAAQEGWLTALREAGQEVYLWRPHQWAEVVETLR